MKVPYFLKYALKETLRKFRFKVERLSEINNFLVQIDNINDKNLKYKIILEKLKSFPESPLLNLSLAKILQDLGDPEKYSQFQKYSDSRNQWLLDTGLDKFDMEFIPPKMYCGSLGNHAAIETIIYANHLNLRNKKKLFAIVDKKYGMPLTNKFFFEYFKPHLNIIDDEELATNLKGMSNILELPLGHCLPFSNSCPTSEVARNIVQKNLIKNNSKSLFNLTDKDRDIGSKILKDMDLPKNAWYVTLHVRGSFWRGENPQHIEHGDKFRTPDINSYIDTIKYITKLGGWVFRMGDTSMQKLPQIPQCIDYAHSKYKSDYMDVFLGATARFSINTPSGFLVIARLFSTPLIHTNCSVFEEYYGLKKNDIYLPPLLKNTKTNEILNLEKFTSFPAGALIEDEHYRLHDLEVVHNTSDELLNATKEMIALTKTSNTSINLTEKQIRFKSLADKNSTLYYGSKLTSNSQISNYFLEKRNII